MKPIEGSVIITHGQQVKIIEVVERNGKYTCYLDQPIVTAGIEYTRDYIDSSEIQKYIE